jgi:hypothetical protein
MGWKDANSPWLPPWFTYSNASSTASPVGQVTVTCTATAFPPWSNLAVGAISTVGASWAAAVVRAAGLLGR